MKIQSSTSNAIVCNSSVIISFTYCNKASRILIRETEKSEDLTSSSYKNTLADNKAKNKTIVVQMQRVKCIETSFSAMDLHSLCIFGISPTQKRKTSTSSFVFLPQLPVYKFLAIFPLTFSLTILKVLHLISFVIWKLLLRKSSPTVLI